MIKILAISTAALMAAHASAATVVQDLGNIAVPPTVSFAMGDNFTTGSNTGLYEFNIVNPMTLTVSSFTNSAVGTKGVFDFTTIGLYSGTGTGGTLLETGTILPRTGGTTLAALGQYALGTGLYTIAYTGNVPSKIATVGSSITFATGAVPEPVTWAMMVVGFGLVGASVRRRAGTVVAA